MQDFVQKRHNAITELVEQFEIEDQDTLVELLLSKYGIEVNQSIISRDLRNLGITKHNMAGKIIYALQKEDPHLQLLPHAIKEILHNESMVIVKTHPALAAFVSEYLDVKKDASILATIAGENVVLVIPVSIKNIKTTYITVCHALRYKLKAQ